MGDRRATTVSFSLDPTATIDGVALLSRPLWCDALLPHGWTRCWLVVARRASTACLWRLLPHRWSRAAAGGGARARHACGAPCRRDACALAGRATRCSRAPTSPRPAYGGDGLPYALAATLHLHTLPLLLLALPARATALSACCARGPTGHHATRHRRCRLAAALLAASCARGAGGVLLILAQLPSR